MEIGETREIEFHQYCKKCEYYKVDENEDPCYECISTAVRSHTAKPVNFKEKE